MTGPNILLIDDGELDDVRAIIESRDGAGVVDRLNGTLFRRQSFGTCETSVVKDGLSDTLEGDRRRRAA